MMDNYINEDELALKDLCRQVKNWINDKEYDSCYIAITDAMKSFPHSPQPNNLMGMLMEKQGNHLLAMKHFRVAWDLDSTYLPARHNLEVFGTFYSKGVGAYEEDDCPALVEKGTYTMEYDKNRIGHMVRRKKNENK